MNKLVISFLNQNKCNRELYLRAKTYNSQYYNQLLIKKFSNYVFKIYFISYIEKSLKLKALEIKRKRRRLSERELYILNAIDDDFKEEKINTIRDNSIDFLEEISNKGIDLKNISANKKLIKAIESITSKQQSVLYMLYIEEKEEKQIARELNVSKQSINKVKLAGLRRIKDYLGGEINGRII